MQWEKKKQKRLKEINNWSRKIDFTWPRDDEFIALTNLIVEQGERKISIRLPFVAHWSQMQISRKLYDCVLCNQNSLRVHFFNESISRREILCWKVEMEDGDDGAKDGRFQVATEECRF